MARPLRIGVDARHLGAGRGVATYLEGMLAAMPPGDDWRLLLPGRGAAPAAARALAARGDVRLVRTRTGGRVLFGAAALTGAPTLTHLLGGDLDAVWVPAPAPVAPGDVPTVLTVHDRSFELRPGDFTRYERAWHAAARPRRLARRAAHVVTDTDAVRDELLGAWGLDPARVTTICPGVRAPRPTSRRAGPAHLARPYVVAVGALEPRKAPGDVVAAAQRAGVAAVLVGEGRLRPQLRGATMLGVLADDELDDVLGGALALVLPSRLEGFGFTPLEAALRGTPSVVSDLPAVRETLGADGALFVAPGDVEGLAAAIGRLRDEPGLRAGIAARARTRAERLSWIDAAAGLRAVLAAVARPA